jgi:hypothetical protein
MQRPLAAVLVCFAFSLVGAGAAHAHDRETNNGVSVTVHIAPDDEPIATQPATIVVEKVETKAKFTWATCKCAWRITDSTGKVVYAKAAKLKTPFVFPTPGAYQLTFSGRVRATKTRWRGFRINYAWRAEQPAA